MNSSNVSCLLFYGPGACTEAQSAALAHGPYAAPPYGMEGLKIDEAREVALLVQRPAVGDRGAQSLVVGPMDAIREGSADALLKSIEEVNASTVRPFLWADDIGEVRSTIVSRCVSVWCPVDPYPAVDEELVSMAETTLSAYQKGNLPVILDCIEQSKGKERQFLLEVVKKLPDWHRYHRCDFLDLWSRLRQTLMSDMITPAQAATALWPPH